MQGDDGAGAVVEGKAGFAQGGLDVAGVEVEVATEFAAVGAQDFQRGECSLSEGQGQGGVPGEEVAVFEDARAEFAAAEDGTAVRAEGFAEGDGLKEARRRFEAELLGGAASVFPEDAEAVGVIDEEGDARGEFTQVGVERSDLAAVGEVSIGEEQDASTCATACQCAGGGARVAMGKGRDAAAEKGEGILERDVGAFVDEGEGEFSGEGLGDGEVGGVAAGDEGGGGDSGKARELGFEGFVEGVVAGGFAGGGDVEAGVIEGVAYGGEDFGMRGEPEVIAPGEVGEFAAACEDGGAVDLLEGFSKVRGFQGACDGVDDESMGGRLGEFRGSKQVRVWRGSGRRARGREGYQVPWRIGQGAVEGFGGRVRQCRWST